jgi:hypothetical protein
MSAEPQTIVHDGLSQLVVVPVAPGGYVFTVNGQKVTIQPGQYFRVPMALWNQGRAICRLRWAREATREEFEATLKKEAVAKPKPVDAKTVTEITAKTSTKRATKTATKTK